RINGQRVEFGRLRPGDELSIAHIRFRLDNGQGHEATLADPGPAGVGGLSRVLGRDAEPHGRELLGGPAPPPEGPGSRAAARAGATPLAAAARGLLPAGLADRCRIQVIVQMDEEEAKAAGSAAGAAAGPAPSGAEKLDACRSDSSP